MICPGYKTIYNDTYARDISKKVRSHLLVKMANGENTKAFVSYGFKKDPNNKNNILIDYNVSHIVEKIHDMFYEGVNKTQIARYLTGQKIKTPSDYKKSISKYYNPHSKTGQWSVNMITKILRDRSAIGDLVLHQYTKINYKVDKVVKVPKEKQIIIEGHHPAIVDRNIFEANQRRLDIQSNNWNYTTSKKSTTHLLRGLVYCHQCRQ